MCHVVHVMCCDQFSRLYCEYYWCCCCCCCCRCHRYCWLYLYSILHSFSALFVHLMFSVGSKHNRCCIVNVKGSLYPHCLTEFIDWYHLVNALDANSIFLTLESIGIPCNSSTIWLIFRMFSNTEWELLQFQYNNS